MPPLAGQLEGSPRAIPVFRLLPFVLGLAMTAGPVVAGSAVAETGAVAKTSAVAETALAQTSVPLECRLGEEPWSTCTMQVERLGEHWWITVGPQRIEFRHDGKGSITMRKGTQASWRSVTANWTADAALCWDGVCARGAIPLD